MSNRIARSINIMNMIFINEYIFHHKARNWFCFLAYKQNFIHIYLFLFWCSSPTHNSDNRINWLITFVKWFTMLFIAILNGHFNFKASFPSRNYLVNWDAQKSPTVQIKYLQILEVFTNINLELFSFNFFLPLYFSNFNHVGELWKLRI